MVAGNVVVGDVLFNEDGSATVIGIEARCVVGREVRNIEFKVFTFNFLQKDNVNVRVGLKEKFKF